MLGVIGRALGATGDKSSPKRILNPIEPSSDAVDPGLYGFSVDLTDRFYQFKREKMACYFGLGFVCRAEEAFDLVGTACDRVYDDDAGSYAHVEPDEVVECCFLGMAMGWSWALFFCHEAISDAMRTALRDAHLPPILVGD